MATDTLPGLLATLQSSLESAQVSLPDEGKLALPANGISLFDTKNELFLSYLHNLVFLILFKIRELKDDIAEEDNDSRQDVWDKTVKTLVELRLYSEKGVKPLESRLRYEIDRVLQAAENDAAAPKDQQNEQKRGKKLKKVNGAAGANGVDASEDEDDEELDSNSESDEDDDNSEEEEDKQPAAAQMPALRANLASLRIPGATGTTMSSSKSGSTRDNESAMGGDSSSTGVYRPPRINPTSMPTTTPAERKARASRGVRSETLNDYLADEISGAPSAMPSVGSNIERHGRSVTTAAQRREADERRVYEETNFVRLPAASKKDRQRDRGDRGGDNNGRMKNGFGGEDWRDLGAGAERVMRELDRKKRGQSALEKMQMRKRGREDVDDFGGGRGGKSAFEKRRKTLQKRARR